MCVTVSVVIIAFTRRDRKIKILELLTFWSVNIVSLLSSHHAITGGLCGANVKNVWNGNGKCAGWECRMWEMENVLRLPSGNAVLAGSTSLLLCDDL